MRMTELGMPVELYTVLIKFNPYAGGGELIVTSSSLERAEHVAEEAWTKYDNVEYVSAPTMHWLDDWSDELEVWH